MQLTNRNRPDRVPEDEAPQPSGPKPRFYDSRQNYLMFVHSCTEKLVIADRVAQELEHLDPQQPALRFFDAGVGDGTVMSRLLRAMHRRFPRLPFYMVGKEISLEDLRLALDKLPDRFVEHPETVVALTNISYAEAPWLRRARPQAQKALVWKDVALHGETSADMEQQIQSLMPFLADHWRMKANPATGALSPETPTVLLLYREAYRFILDRVIPRPAATRADFDLVLASQPFRLKADVQFKAERVLAPLARALRPGGRLIVVQSAGDDPAMEIIRKVWPEEQPFPYGRQDLIRATQAALSGGTAHYAFDTLSDEAASIRFEMHVLGSEGDRDATLIGTSALYSAWIAATYVAQIENERVAEQMTGPGYLAATREVLAKHGRLWFRDECLVIERVE